MGKFCRNCGKELKENADVCLNCGVSTQANAINNTINKTDRNTLIGFILGFCSIVAWFIPLFGYPVTICGIVFSAKGLNSTTNKGKAITGLVLSIVFLIFTLINSILGALIGLNYYY